MNHPYNQAEPLKPGFNPLKIIIPVLLALLSISLMSQWYASNISVPRYCKNPEKTLQSLEKLLDESSLIENEQRRQAMIAAKLLFLHPRQNDESRADYLQRLRYLMLAQCS
jgi:hypothetical protein